MNSEAPNRPHRRNWRLIAKLFLPSWNFFNDFAEVSCLEFSWLGAAATETDWRPLYPENSTTSWGRMFFNPAGNLELLEKSLIDRIASGFRDEAGFVTCEFEAEEAIALLARLTRGRLRLLEPPTAESQFRFRLVLLEPGGGSEVLFTSGPQQLTESAP